MTFVSAMLDSPRGPVFLDFDDPGNGEFRISRHDLVGMGGPSGQLFARESCGWQLPKKSGHKLQLKLRLIRSEEN